MLSALLHPTPPWRLGFCAVWRNAAGGRRERVAATFVPPGETGAREPLADAARRLMLEIPIADAQTGALILFRMRAGAVAKHCGILAAPDRFIHAYEHTGVIEEALSAAWRRRVAFAFLFPAG